MIEYTMDSQIKLLTPTSWVDYELIDSGNEEKLERFGKYIFVRPETKALWKKTLSPNEWNKAHAVYERSTEGVGQWIYKTQLEPSWTMNWKNLSFQIRPTGFKHMGIFPEQAAIWDWIIDKITTAKRPVSLLNLFGYTGGSTLAGASAGASITHIDAARDVLTWANDNAKLSKLDTQPIRWIPEDVTTFVKREITRGKKYDAIVMDPPKFGRGTKNEVWKIEEDLPRLLDLCSQLLSEDPLFIVLNAYAVSYSSITFGTMLRQMMHKFKGRITFGELATKNTSNQILLPNSVFSIWEK